MIAEVPGPFRERAHTHTGHLFRGKSFVFFKSSRNQAANPSCPAGTAEGCELFYLISRRRLQPGRRPRPQPPPNHIQHITAIAQRNGAEQGEIAEDEGLALDRTAHGQVLKHLGDCTNSVVGSVGEDVEWRVGIDEQGGHIGAVAGQCHEAVVGMGDWFFVGWIGMY